MLVGLVKTVHRTVKVLCSGARGDIQVNGIHTTCTRILIESPAASNMIALILRRP